MSDPRRDLAQGIQALLEAYPDVAPRDLDFRALLQLGEILTRIPGPWAGPLFACLPYARMIVQPHHVAMVVLKLVQAGRAFDDALAQVTDALGIAKAPGQLCADLAGPDVAQEFELAEGIMLSPSPPPDFGAMPWVSMDEMVAPPSCSVRVAAVVEPVFSNTGNFDPPASDPFREQGEIIGDLELLLVLLTHPVPVTSCGVRFVLDDPTIDALSHARTMRSLRSDGLRRVPGPYTPVDPDKVRELWPRWRRLQDVDRRRLRLALDRINRSLLQVRLVDKCIEACISLEILLGGQPSDSVTHKIATRCGRFVREDRVKQDETCKFVKLMYSARSSGVHAGELKKSVTADQVHALSKLAVYAIVKMLEIGRVPDESHLDFGPPEEEA